MPIYSIIASKANKLFSINLFACFLLTLSIFCCNTVLAQEEDDFRDFPTGMILDEEEDKTYHSKPRRARYDSKKFTELPLRVNLKPYCPLVGDQGEINSCVGWATGYGALTIQQAIENGWTDKRMITKNAHSALFIYNQIKVADCNEDHVLVMPSNFCPIMEIAMQEILIAMSTIVSETLSSPFKSTPKNTKFRTI